MSTSRCLEAFLDWQTTGGHYDSRNVRSCRPGGYIDTDPGGDGYWVEPSDWDGRTIVNMQKGAGVSLSDTYVAGEGFAINGEPDRFAGSGTAPMPIFPRTCVDTWARVRTLYQDGHIESCDMRPQSS